LSNRLMGSCPYIFETIPRMNGPLPVEPSVAPPSRDAVVIS
jgi:hypothetical protein